MVISQPLHDTERVIPFAERKEKQEQRGFYLKVFTLIPLGYKNGLQKYDKLRIFA